MLLTLYLPFLVAVAAARNMLNEFNGFDDLTRGVYTNHFDAINFLFDKVTATNMIEMENSDGDIVDTVIERVIECKLHRGDLMHCDDRALFSFTAKEIDSMFAWDAQDYVIGGSIDFNVIKKVRNKFVERGMFIRKDIINACERVLEFVSRFAQYDEMYSFEWGDADHSNLHLLEYYSFFFDIYGDTVLSTSDNTILYNADFINSLAIKNALNLIESENESERSLYQNYGGTESARGPLLHRAGSAMVNFSSGVQVGMNVDRLSYYNPSRLHDGLHFGDLLHIAVKKQKESHFAVGSIGGFGYVPNTDFRYIFTSIHIPIAVEEIQRTKSSWSVFMIAYNGAHDGYNEYRRYLAESDLVDRNKRYYFEAYLIGKVGASVVTLDADCAAITLYPGATFNGAWVDKDEVMPSGSIVGYDYEMKLPISKRIIRLQARNERECPPSADDERRLQCFGIFQEDAKYLTDHEMFKGLSGTRIANGRSNDAKSYLFVAARRLVESTHELVFFGTPSETCHLAADPSLQMNQLPSSSLQILLDTLSQIYEAFRSYGNKDEV